MTTAMADQNNLAGLLTGNRTPSGEEKILVEQFVASSDKKLNIVREKISDLKAYLQALEEEEAALLEVVAPYKRALSPFRSLPEDMIREIFIACLETGHNPTMSNKDAPVLLTQISSGLRQIALTTPTLWAAIHIPVVGLVQPTLDDEARTLMAKRVEGLKEWLRRSGSLPLSISVRDPRDSGITTNIFAEDVIDVLINCCSRWKDVMFACLPGSLSRVAALNESDAPLLQSLAFYFGRYSTPCPGIWAESKLLLGPALTKFDIHGRAERICDYSVNWANLTHLTLGGRRLWEPTEALSTIACILRQTTRLISCDIDNHEDYIPETPDVGEILLPFLKVLVIAQQQVPFGHRGILHSLHAPLLETFIYNLRSEIGRESPLTALLKRSPNIRELGLGRAVSHDIIIEYLRCCPFLTMLHLRGVGHDDGENDLTAAEEGFIEAFVTNDEDQCLCPRLEYFHCESLLDISVESLRKFILRKTGMTPRLNSWKGIIMEVQCDTEAETLIKKLRLEAGEDSGMKFSITCYRNDYLSCALDQGIMDDRRYNWWPTAASRPRLY